MLADCGYVFRLLLLRSAAEQDHKLVTVFKVSFTLAHMAPAVALDRITVDPEQCGGKPCIRHMRITVRRVLEILAMYSTREEIFREYPFLEEADLQQALRHAALTAGD